MVCQHNTHLLHTHVTLLQCVINTQHTNTHRYLIIYVSEGCRPQNRLYYLDLATVPKHEASGALDFTSFDFLKGRGVCWAVFVFVLSQSLWGCASGCPWLLAAEAASMLFHS